MQRVLISIFLLISIQAYEGAGPRDSEWEYDGNSAPKVPLSQQFLVGMKEIAYSMNGYSFLRSIEGTLNNVSNSYKKSNTLANVTFSACILAPELKENSEVAAARLTAHDLDVLHHHMVFVQSYVIELADRQHLEAAVPLLLRSVNQMDRLMLPVYLSAEALAEACKENVILKTLAHVAEGCFESQEAIHSLKSKMLVDMLSNYEKVGALASYINVGKLDRSDNFRIEAIGKSLKEINTVFKKADVL